MSGRPTDYNSEFHPKELVRMMEEGKLDCEIQAAFDISPSTFYRWKREHEEFREAHEKGLPKAETRIVIEPLRQMALVGETGKGQYKAISHLARNKFGHDQQAAVVNKTININTMNVLNTREEYDQLEQEVKQHLLELNIVDTEYKELSHDDEKDPSE